MSDLIEVILIHKDRVSKQLENLNKAEALTESSERTRAVAVAKKQIRDYARITDYEVPTTRMVAQQEVAVYRKYLRDVGENNFVFDDDLLRVVQGIIEEKNGGIK